MTTVDWAVICDLAYFDRFNRLCLLGIETSGKVRTLPAGIHRLAVAIHLQDRDPDDDPDVSLFVTSPQGQWRAADEVGDFCVESRGEYLLLHMPSFPLQEEGIYRFELACGVKEPAVCEMSVVVQSHRPARIHLHGAY
jgi:hypothetical protein